jgi:hypothetical protein
MKTSVWDHNLQRADIKTSKSIFLYRISKKAEIITQRVELNPKSMRRPLSICLYPDQGHSDAAWNTVPVKLKNQNHRQNISTQFQEVRNNVIRYVNGNALSHKQSNNDIFTNN